jgi:hypothetical protein
MCNRLAGGGPNYCWKSRNGAPSPPKAEVTSSNLVGRASPIKLLRQTYPPTPQRDVFRSVADLKTAINRFVAETNANPKPFVWAADPRRVLAAIKRGKQALESVH